jgi:hypothetical protein
MLKQDRIPKKYKQKYKQKFQKHGPKKYNANTVQKSTSGAISGACGSLKHHRYADQR